MLYAEDIALRSISCVQINNCRAGTLRVSVLIIDGWFKVLRSEDVIAIVRNHQVGAGLSWAGLGESLVLLTLVTLALLVVLGW